jgi:hypothetical protein
MMSEVKPSNLPKDDAKSETNADVHHQQRQQKSLWTSLLEILDSDKLPEYAVFKLEGGRTRLAMFMNTIQTIIQVSKILTVTARGDGIPLMNRLINYLHIIVPLLAWVYIYFFRKYVHSNVLRSEGKRIIQLGNAVILMQSVFATVLLLVWVITHEDCHSDVCMQDFPKKMIPLGLLFQQFIGIVATPLLFTCHDVSACLRSVFITFSIFLVAAALRHLPFVELVLIFMLGCLTFFTLVSYESNIYSSFTSFCKFETTLRAKVDSENKEYLMKIQTEEMRHMIGTCRTHCRLCV